MTLSNILSYSTLYDNPEFVPAGTKDEILEQVKHTMASWDASTPTSQDAIQLHKDVLLDFGIDERMTDGIFILSKQ